MRVVVYTSTAHYKQVDKTGKLTVIGDVDAVLKEPTNIVDPVFTFGKDNITNRSRINYVWVPDFERYYFAKADFLPAGIIQLTCHADGLMSQYQKLKGTRCQVKRNEFDYNMDLPDPDIPVMVERQISYQNFSTTPFSTNPQGRHFVLTVSGSSALGGGVS